MSTDDGRAIWKPAHKTNYSPASERTGYDRIVIHKIEGSAQSAINKFQSELQEASAHYVVDFDGTVYQCVREKDVAWQAGFWPTNQKSIGIEHSGFVGEDDNTEEMYEASARLVASICSKRSIPLDRQHIIGHYQVPGCPNPGGGGVDCHTDPQPHWRWRHYMHLVRKHAS